MKLEQIKKFEPNIQAVWNSVVLENNKVVVLATDHDNKYLLLIGTEDSLESFPLDYLETIIKTENKPVLFSIGNQFGIIKSPSELFLYHSQQDTPQEITISNKKLFSQVLPDKIRLYNSTAATISDSNTLAVSFQMDAFVDGNNRYIAFLEVDVQKSSAQWKSWTQLDSSTFQFHIDAKYPPKIDCTMIKDKQLYAFTSGGKYVSVSKWGMDYYALVKASDKGSIIDTLLDSGDLHADEKKKGVNAVFSSSEKYAMLTPVFQSGEWKGKQKLFCMETKTLIDIDFPRGFGKYPQVIQHKDNRFWVYLRDSREIAVCKEVEYTKIS